MNNINPPTVFIFFVEVVAILGVGNEFPCLSHEIIQGRWRGHVLCVLLCSPPMKHRDWKKNNKQVFVGLIVNGAVTFFSASYSS